MAEKPIKDFSSSLFRSLPHPLKMERIFPTFSRIFQITFHFQSRQRCCHFRPPGSAAREIVELQITVYTRIQVDPRITRIDKIFGKK